MQSSTGLASLLGAYNSDSDDGEDIETNNLTKPSARGEESKTHNQVTSTSWTTCIDKVSGSPYFWNMDTKEVCWEKPEELVHYLAYVEMHKDELMTSYGHNRFTTHSGLAHGSVLYLDQLYRMVSWEMPVDMQRNAVEDEQPPPNGGEPGTPATGDDVPVATLSDSASRSTNNYSPPPLFANVTTTVTVEDIDAAAGGTRWGSQAAVVITDGDGRQEAMNGEGRNGNAEDFVVASKRRRRIEIPRITQAKNTTKPEEQLQHPDEIVAVACAVNAGLIGLDKSQASMYANNFRAGGVEFNDKPESRGAEPEEESVGDSLKNNTANAAAARCEKCAAPTVKTGTKSEEEQETQERMAIKSIADLVGGKMKFLSDGRPAVSGVQTMAIQLETLMCAYEVSELGASYLGRWLRATADKLQQLEQEVAPAGWKCKWDRDTKRYIYESLETGNRQWDFPQPDVERRKEDCGGDDEMDISTTPPHESVPEFELPDAVAQPVAEPPPLPPPQENENVKPPLPPPPPSEIGCCPSPAAAASGPIVAWNVHPVGMAPEMVNSLPGYEIPGSGAVAGHSADRLNFELDSFYSDIATIECNQVSGEGQQEGEGDANRDANGDGGDNGTVLVSSVVVGRNGSQHKSVQASGSEDVTTNKGTVSSGDKVSKNKKKKKVKTSLSDIKEMSHLISKWQKAQQDL